MDNTILQEPTPSNVQPLFKKRGAKNIRKRPATPPPASSDSESGYTSTEDEGRRVKRRKKTALVTASSSTTSKSQPQDLTTTSFAADRSAQISATDDATKTSNWFDNDSNPNEKSLLGTSRNRPTSSNKETDPPSSHDGTTYKGAASYQSFIPKNPNAPSRTVGPVKAPTNIRTITVTDFAPDVCKDYKQTGWCGFGDRYIHSSLLSCWIWSFANLFVGQLQIPSRARGL